MKKLFMLILFSVFLSGASTQAQEMLAFEDCINLTSSFDWESETSKEKYYVVKLENICDNTLIVTVTTRNIDGVNKRCCNFVSPNSSVSLTMTSTTAIFHYSVKQRAEDESANEKKKIKKTEPDDFWEGADDKTKVKAKGKTNQNESNDYWNGSEEKKKSTSTDNSDFWDGQGTSNEEESFSANTKPIESNQFIGEIESKTKTIKIVCRDHGEEDGDRVQIRNNKSIIKSNLYLTNAKKEFTVTLSFGMNRIDFEALSEGTSSPNTAEFEVYDDSGKLISTNKWSITKGFTATLLIVKL